MCCINLPFSLTFSVSKAEDTRWNWS